MVLSNKQFIFVKWEDYKRGWAGCLSPAESISFEALAERTRRLAALSREHFQDGDLPVGWESKSDEAGIAHRPQRGRGDLDSGSGSPPQKRSSKECVLFSQQSADPPGEGHNHTRSAQSPLRAADTATPARGHSQGGVTVSIPPTLCDRQWLFPHNPQQGFGQIPFGSAPTLIGADAATSKNRTAHNQSRKWHRNGIKNPPSRRHMSLKGVDPKLLRNTRFAKRHSKKGLKETQANSAKAASTCAEAAGAPVSPGSAASPSPDLRSRPPGADAATSKNRTAHNQSRKWHRNGIKNPPSRRHMSLKGVDPKLLRNTRFAKRHSKKGLKETQANSAKAASTCAEAAGAPVKPKEATPRTHRAAASSVHSPAPLTPSSGNVQRARARSTAEGLRLCPPKARDRLRPRPQRQLQLQLRLPKAPRPPPRLQSRGLHRLT
ncbi:hypothetical protein CB1_000874001 [Camelus ferus]|nr:hypothetical protein CB1_000874001 [Camelus ferus]